MRCWRVVGGAVALGLVLAGCSGTGQAREAPAADEVEAGPQGAPTPTPPPEVAAKIRPRHVPGAVDGRDSTPVVERGPAEGKRIALTFDADLTKGMRERLRSGEVDSYYNADLIALLRRQDVPATLFLTGLWMQEYPEVTEDLAADPLFELGTHSHTHRAFTRDCYSLAAVPPGEMLEEVTRAVRILDRHDEGATRYFRFPGGCHDRTALHRTAPAGVTAIGIDIAAGDGFADDAEAIARTVTDAARPGAIVTLHMNGGDIAPRTDEAVRSIVRELRRDGYEFVTVSALLGDR